LKIKHFLGTSENAVKIQIAVALIAYLIIRLAHQAQTQVPSILAFARLLRVNIFHYKRTDALRDPPRSNRCQRQLSFL
jgi:IS4 transposase